MKFDDVLETIGPFGKYQKIRYSKEIYSSTIVSQFDLVCERKFWKSTSKSVFFLGRLCGAVLFGQLSDRFGRRPMFFVGAAILLVAGSIAAAAQNIYMFLPMYFLQGVAQAGIFLVAFTLSTELVGPKYRLFVGIMILMFYSVGYMTLSGMAYVLRDWRYLELAITLPVLLFAAYWWFLPESVRWLLSQNKNEDAQKYLQKAAAANGTVLPTSITENVQVSTAVKTDRKYYFIDLVRTWSMAKISLNLWFNWFVNALVYYGLSLNTETLAGDPYLNFCIAGAVEIPALLLCMISLNKVGRRIPLFISMCVGGIACILSGTIPINDNSDLETLKVVLAMIGKFFITASYGIIHLMTAEVLPTVVRNIGMGVASMSARIGGILVPTMLDLKSIWTPLPLVIFGSLSIAAGILALLLPETTDKPLPQLLEDVSNSKEKYSSTIVSQFDLVCKKKFWTSTSKSVFFLGRLCGAVSFGQLSDRFGRRPMFFVGAAILLVAGSIAAAAQNIYMFLPMYFLQGVAQAGIFLVAFTLSTELVGPKYRLFVGIMILMFYSVGYMTLSGMAYVLRDWRYLELAITLPVLLFAAYWWFLPESVRWLLSQNKNEDAQKYLQKAAAANGTVLPTSITENVQVSTAVKTDRKYYFIDLVRTWSMAKISLNLWFNWFVNALVYYGLSLNTETLAGDPYLNFCIAGAVEIPALLLCMISLNKVGRRIPLFISMCVGGIACILSGTIPINDNSDLETLKVVLAMIGKFFITASYGIIHLMTAEVLPTVVRNIGMGVASMSARIGGILVPTMLDLKSIWTPLPLVIFGSLSIAAGILALLLPETTDKPLPQLLEDVSSKSKKLEFETTEEEREKCDDTLL
ncbi:organic cation/carnitine transporter 2-like [Patella vulgata]|uniref:organic cation/carnitine transporter 2-like n=1 Tax=Patella vulgata TaxID=6465 RepID=UPI0024A9C360|nr:organic cation/carnitine transporter 2-like [Patella vulgata]